MTIDQMGGAVFVWLLQWGLGGCVAGTVAYLLVTRFATGYLTQKGVNLATKEDIAAITREVERVRTEYARQLLDVTHQYGLILEELRGKAQLRLVASEKRLDAHQQGFTLWREMIAVAPVENPGPMVAKCMDWWDRNCLYLTAEARNALSNAYEAFKQHPTLRRMPHSDETVDILMKNWKRVTDAGNALLEGVNLPPLSDAELEEAADRGR